jgi:hypothetical protein
VILASSVALSQVLSQEPSTAEDIRDIRGIISLAGLPWWVYLAGLLILVLATALIYWWKTKKTAPTLKESMEARALRELQETRLHLAEGKAREFSLHISEVLRRYIEDRYHIPAVKQTTEEFLQKIRQTHLMPEHAEQLNVFLQLCDQAKFGKDPLSLEEMETMWTGAQQFVERSSVSLALGQNTDSPKEAKLGV